MFGSRRSYLIVQLLKNKQSLPRSKSKKHVRIGRDHHGVSNGQSTAKACSHDKAQVSDRYGHKAPSITTSISRPRTRRSAPINTHHHGSGEGPPGGGHESSSYPFSDLSEGGGVGRLSVESSVARRNASAWLLQGKGGGLPSRR